MSKDLDDLTAQLAEARQRERRAESNLTTAQQELAAARVSAQHRRRFIGTELNPAYIALTPARVTVQIKMGQVDY